MDMRRSKGILRFAGTFMAASLLLTALPFGIPGELPKGNGTASQRGMLLAAGENPYRVYTFAEVGLIAQINSTEIIRQKATITQAEYNKESQLSNYQGQVYAYYSDPDSGISESSLYSLQDSYESAYNSYLDAEETMEKLKPKVAYQAQKLYIDILQAELQIKIQEQEIQRLKDEYELAKVKTAFGVLTQSQLKSAQAQLDNAEEALDSLKKSMDTNKNSMREYLDLADEVEFGLENPPVIGQYANAYDEVEVRTGALKNSLALKQAQREVEELTKQIERYQDQGLSSQAERLAVNGPSKDLALKETRKTLERTVENTIKEYGGLEEALDKAKENVYAAKRALITIRMKMSVGAATLNELRLAEKAVMTAEKEQLQAQYNGYLGAKKVLLLKEGVLVS
jgi:hypothetical protein